MINKKYRLSRIRTYIRDLEGPCPDPLDDEPRIFFHIMHLSMGGTGFEPVTTCL